MTTEIAVSRWMNCKDVMFETRFSRAKAYEVMHQIGPIGKDGSLRITRNAFEHWISQQEGGRD